MKRTGLFLIVMVILAFALVQQGRSLAQRDRAQIPPDRVAQRAEMSQDKVVSTQQRVNRYFHNDVVPKLKECWRGVQGRGMVQFEYSFTKAGSGRWVLDTVSASSSSLAAGEDAKALRCMQTATRGTSFASTADDATQSAYTLIWNWPVPYPTNGDVLKNTMFAMRANNGGSTSSDDCDGHGTKAKCQTCKNGVCTTVCVGTKKCTIEGAGGPLNCTGSGGYCASGGPFGVSGGTRVIF